MLVAALTQERTALLAGPEGVDVAGNVTAFGDPRADVETPVRVEVIHDPLEAFHLWELRGDAVEVLHPVDAGSRRAQVPNDLTRGYAERCQQSARAVADVLELAFLDAAGSGQSRWILALENLHPSLFVAGQDQAALFVQTRGIEIQPADVVYRHVADVYYKSPQLQEQV
jgi:hypothetical protein